ncbi:hypothetical protein EON80_02020 [bacterium]|nr:MAG: hypothetical protein EON80_02020 [bacterium]
MAPLHWPESYQPTPREPRSFWERLPLIGEWFEASDYPEVVPTLMGQLAARPKPDPTIWGDDPVRVEMALYLCNVVQQAYGWPNDHFLPEDPFEIVFLEPWDDLEIIECAMQVEEDLGLDLPDETVKEWGGTLGNVVDSLVAIQKSAHRN